MLIRLLLIIFTFVELNCENLFDTVDNPFTNDDEFTENSLRHWDKRKYHEKLNNIGKEIISCAEHPKENGEGHMPDMIALCEVENDSVMDKLTKHTMLWSYNYDYLITSSSDSRGMNVALIYNPNAFKLIDGNSIHVELSNKKTTRDILHAKGLIINHDTLHVFVVHAPSRRSGEKETRKDRFDVAKTLSKQIDSLQNATRTHINIAGDFNDYTGDAALIFLESHGVYEISKNAVGIYPDNDCKGTYFFNEEWNSLDHIFTSKSLKDSLIDCFINNNPRLLDRDSNGNIIPKRSYKGIRYNHGFSDHLPLIARFNFSI